MPLHTVPLDSPATLGAASSALQQGDVGDQVLLVLPEQADDLASEVRLKVLRRQADALQVQVGLVTRDADIRHFARKARIPTFSSVEKAQKRWRYPKPPASLPPPSLVRPLVIDPPRDVGRDVKAPAIVTVGGATLLDGRTRQRKDRWWLTWLGYLLLIIVVAALIGGVALMVLPQATVTVVPARTQFVSSIELSSQVGIDEPDYLNGVTPARAVQARVDVFGTIATSGLDEAPVGKAAGVVTFINKTNREIQIPQNTIVRTTTGDNVRFRTLTEAATPPGVGQQVTIPIEAVEPGRRGNVPAFTINEIEGPLNVSLRVSNQSPTAGGTVESVAVVTQADKDRLLGQLQEQLQRQAYDQLAAGLEQGEIIPPETVSTYTLAETYDRFAGEQADVLGLQLQLLARGLAVDLNSANALAERSLRESIPFDHFLLEESIRIGQPNFTRFSSESADFTLTASADTLIPITTGQVRSLLICAPLEDAETILLDNLALAVPPEITLEPNWLDRLPCIPTRIVVRVLQSQ
ncbi:MAG TPA: hypothetical protein G4N94_07190 [Caldilineae bacterium]|nr:hypothetical protein [Caldilineae bacterium]